MILCAMKLYASGQRADYYFFDKGLANANSKETVNFIRENQK